MACSEGCHQGLQPRRRGALDHVVHQRRTAIYGKARRVSFAALAARDGADGGPDAASCRATRPAPLTRYRRRPPRTRLPHPVADRQVRADRQLGARTPAVLLFREGRAWASQPDASACSLLTADIPWAAQGQRAE
jgi:hypothetical protein